MSGSLWVPLVARLCDHARMSEKLQSRTLERIGHTAHGSAESMFALLLRQSWSALGLTMLGLYLTINVVFAVLFLLVPGSIAGSEGGFADAFFLSVQSLATIGYGVLSPKGLWGNLLVTVESFVGIAYSALATGVFFAKFARPKPHVLFSRVCVVNVRDGVPTLCFRVGNLRGVDIVEAAIRVSVLRTHITAEGERMRRFYDIPLERDRTPLFTISWLVLHRIDERSPLIGATHDSLVAEDARLIVSLTGYDEAFGQTVYARHSYDARMIKFGERFVDVLETLPDGGVRVDFGRFHETQGAPPQSAQT